MTADARADRRAAVLWALAALLAARGAAADDERAWCGTGPEGVRQALALHAWAVAGPAAGAARAAAAGGVADADVNDVALLTDRGDLVVARNPFDLDGRAVRLLP